MADGKSAVNPWLVAVAVVVPTFMEVLDTTIANVALRYIAGGLSAAQTDAEWVITSYLAANAIVLPISGWLSNRLGRRNYFLGSIAVFTLASLACGVATSLNELILFRVIQGLAGGGLQPSTQGILLDSFPANKQGQAMTLFGIAALVAPIVGPTLGGWITDNYSWRWVFLINVPFGGLALAACAAVVTDPPAMVAARAKLRGQPLRFDFIGLGLLVLVMATWETCLSKGQEWNGLADAYWRFQPAAAVFVVALVALVVRELTTANPVVNLRPLAGPELFSPPRSSARVRTGCCTARRRRCRGCCKPCSGTTRRTPGWSCRRRGCSRSRACRWSGFCSAKAPTPGG